MTAFRELAGIADRELVVGIGSIEKRDTEFKGGGIRRVVGLTTFFSNDGRFLMTNTNRAVPYEEYFEELLKGLEASLHALSRSEEHPWEDGDTVRIIFHIFKPIKNIEADVVAELIKKFPMYNIRYAFVTVSTRHPFIMFDKQQGFSGQPGNFVPLRGVNVKLSNTEWLVQARGSKEMKIKKHGFSRPILVRLHEKSTFRDLHHIVEQIMNFTHLSWKSFNPTYLPVTIYYADEIAKWLDRLDGLDGWNPGMINSSLKRKKWFL
ncbi:MAG: Piwi domain-containing protein [Leucothrix sp.]